jgi:peroxiredoxin
VKKEWANKKVVLVSVPGAFTPTCAENHLPGYIKNLSTLKQKGVDIVAVTAFNDAWVMSAWGKSYGIKNDDIVSCTRSVNEPCTLLAKMDSNVISFVKMLYSQNQGLMIYMSCG